jgi:hypothetical protein
MVTCVAALLDLHNRGRLAILFEQPLVKGPLPAQIEDAVVRPRRRHSLGMDVFADQADDVADLGGTDHLPLRAGVVLLRLDQERAVDLPQLRGKGRRRAGEPEPPRQERVPVHAPPALRSLAFHPRREFDGWDLVVRPAADAGLVTQHARAVPVDDPHVGGGSLISGVSGIDEAELRQSAQGLRRLPVQVAPVQNEFLPPNASQDLE